MLPRSSEGILPMVIRRQNVLQPLLLQRKQSSKLDRRRNHPGCVIHGPPSAE